MPQTPNATSSGVQLRQDADLFIVPPSLQPGPIRKSAIETESHQSNQYSGWSRPEDTLRDSPPSGVQLKQDADLLIQHYLQVPPELPPKPRPSGSETEFHHPRRHSGWSRPGDTTSDSPPGHPLPLPLCIPQIGASPDFDSPFARGYNDDLWHFVGISQEMLLNFIDGLNLAIQANPPLMVVNLVGGIIGFIWALIAGTVMNVTAEAGTPILSKSLTDRYLRAANLNLFHPRGLSARLCTTPAMRLLISETDQNGETKKKGKKREMLNQFGRGVGSAVLKSPIPIPFGRSIVRAVADKAPSIAVIEGETIQGSMLRRRLAVVQEPGLALPLKLDGMPPPEKPKGVMDKMSAWGVKADGWLEGRRERRNEQRRRALKRLEEETPEDSRPVFSTDPSKHEKMGLSDALNIGKLAGRANDYLEKRNMKKEIKEEIKFRDRQRDKGKSSQSPMQKRVAEEDLLEHWATDEVLWIVIMNVENDSQIDGIQKAESAEEVEYVDEKTWRKEMMEERVDMEKKSENGGLQDVDDRCTLRGTHLSDIHNRKIFIPACARLGRGTELELDVNPHGKSGQVNI
ncbi:hypothetical protein D9758_008146 [Tetrapyrgos nigripes]|uniref:Uncharacterized protein n=1 Tax=Tetrapyrgos nigripes TaxID=182062 RepID=A0A8H5GH12_9AGAR|nr:hypothetical protein D9758_008146 [Tetrapyrgos nigripes]